MTSQHVVVFNTGEAPASESLYAAFNDAKNPSQIMSEAEAISVAGRLHGVGSKTTVKPSAKIQAWVAKVSDSFVEVNERINYVRIKPDEFFK